MHTEHIDALFIIGIVKCPLNELETLVGLTLQFIDHSVIFIHKGFSRYKYW